MRTEWLYGAGFGLALALGATGCKSSAPAPIVDGTTAVDSSDPADVNMAPVSGSATTAQVMGQRSEAPPQQVSGETYPAQAANQPPLAAYEQAYEQDQDAVDAGQQALYADAPPPPLPDYQQPELTDPGYEWTPGYWDYGSSGYYWVPGVWVEPPFAGALWTPAYWQFSSGRYRFHRGFWSSHIGYYGGINYGYGYTGSGYHGGYWQGNNFYYNRQVNRVNTNVVRNVYTHNVETVNNTRVSFNGPQGVNARPSAADVAVYRERVVPAMHVQTQQAQAAAQNRQQFYSANHGQPAAAAVAQHLPADRTPPPAIRPAPEVRQQVMPNNTERPGVANQPAGRPEQGQQIRQTQPAQPEQPFERPPRVPRPSDVTQPQRQMQPAPAQPAPAQTRPMQEARPQVQPQQQQQVRPVPEQRPVPEVRPQPQAQPQPRPAPEVRPQPQEARPQPQQLQQQARPAPEVRPQPQPTQQQARPMPENRPQAQPQTRPEQHAAPQPQARPAPPPQAAPKPAPAPHPAEPQRDDRPKP